MGVAAASDKTLFDSQNFGAGGIVILVIEPFDDLKSPSPFENVATDNVLPQRVGFFVVSAFGQPQRALLEEKVSPPDQLMKSIQMTAGSFHVFECLPRFADRVNGLQIDTSVVSSHFRTPRRATPVGVP
jgi:hypothetical protein